jgi:hypothetical protein
MRAAQLPGLQDLLGLRQGEVIVPHRRGDIHCTRKRKPASLLLHIEQKPRCKLPHLLFAIHFCFSTAPRSRGAASEDAVITLAPAQPQRYDIH